MGPAMALAMEMKSRLEWFEQTRPLLEGMAYRMLGSRSDSEDVIQDAFIRWSGVRLKGIDNPKAYLVSCVSRLCIDRLRRRKIEKLTYTGPWLPEPVADGSEPDESLGMVQTLHMGFLVMLEKLNPLERAVFILRESFDRSHREIACALSINESHSRQLLRRARRQIVVAKEPDALEENIVSLVEAFIEAARSGDVESFQEILCEDIVAFTDGGGKVSAAVIPLEGRDLVSRVFFHLFRKSGPETAWYWTRVNGQPGLLIREGSSISSVFSFELKERKLHRIYVMRNPHKLGSVRITGAEKGVRR